MSVLIALVLCSSLVLGAPPGSAKPDRNVETKDVDLRMPNVQPRKPDTYLCTTMKMNAADPNYIVGFKPHGDMAITHHILLYGCTSPGSQEKVWNCGEMAEKGYDYTSGPVCGSGSKIIYAWAMDAPSLTLPEGVGFEVGGDTDVQYLVLQVHYKDVTSFLPPSDLKDNSGVTLMTTNVPMPRRAGVYLLGTGGEIPAHSTVFMETACSYREPFDIHPFAFRTHAHSLGQVVSGYRIRNGQWTEIGRKSPKLPQMFYNATTPNLVIKQGDILAARCTMKNDLDHVVRVGNTQNDEMCNFYVMYYVDGDKIMQENYCFTQGPSTWYWRDFGRASEMNLDHVPKEVSLIPGKKEPLVETDGRPRYRSEDGLGLDVLDDFNNEGDEEDSQILDIEDPETLDRLLELIRDRSGASYRRKIDDGQGGYFVRR